MDNGNISRRGFLKKLSWFLVLIYSLLAGLSIKRQNQLRKKETIRIASDIPSGVSFQDDIIIVNNKNSLVFLSSRCTHLGCKINSTENKELICPCHGSRFTLDGKVIRGPAQQPLQKLNFSRDVKSGEIIVKL